MKYIKYFNQIDKNDLYLVGGKNLSLGLMIRHLNKENINIPQGFAITSQAYWYYINYYNLKEKIKKILSNANLNIIDELQQAGKKIRKLILSHNLPEDLQNEVSHAYDWLKNYYNQKNLSVAVRSSGTAEDLPNASFAGQQESYLNIQGKNNLIKAIKLCIASLFTDRAIIYRENNKFDHFKVGISVGIQKMVRSDKASSGVCFTLDPETGFENVVVINSSYGLGENIVKGTVNPDEFHVHKETLLQGYSPIIKKYLGSKEKKLIYYKKNNTKNVSVPKKERKIFSLLDNEILDLAKQGIIIEKYYYKLNNYHSAMDIEWAKDGLDNKIYIVQARQETVHNKNSNKFMDFYHINSKNLNIITKGISIGRKIVSGKARILKSIKDSKNFNKGDILVTQMTDPDWSPIIKKAGAIVTDQGGRTCHAAIVSRELGTPAIVGTLNATQAIKDGEIITVDCSKGSIGYVYSGKINYNIDKIEINNLPQKLPVDILINIADPNRAYELSYLPTKGVGLARIEFIISDSIKIHPMAICKPSKVTNYKIIKTINNLASAYKDAQAFFIDTLAQSIGTIAAAFYPRSILLRFSDFKTNEYRNLIGGSYFEPIEENPMLGFRGTARYCSKDYSPAFELECLAVKKAIEIMGFTNINIILPFVRTIEEAKCSLDIMKKYNLNKSKNKHIKIFMMCEIPSNVLLLEEFGDYFDGFSIGSNDLTQLTLGVDRDSAKIAELFDERNLAIKIMFRLTIEKAKKINKKISICGQAPSDYPEIADFLIENKIDAISLNPDSIIPFVLKYKKN